ncbi:SAUR-like auxin-responsive protein family [Striga asiatica]|uniref:SAUR-like auxin-responsive protein family n=1 Tax=Striga asiatica TaxID=4170 RepID=A0A5A7P5Q8_STRAF|nr:SAUR-like auxin-responsive protein family [Striga asiatica]
MAKIRGFRLGRRLVSIFRRRRSAAYHRLEPPAGPVSKLRGWLHFLGRRARRAKPGGYARLGKEPAERRPNKPPPKGHMVVYVGDGEEEACRAVVPVVYFNHPLFGELLTEAERVYGFDHPAGIIQIPCPKSRLESVRTRIAATSGGGMWRRRWSGANS